MPTSESLRLSQNLDPQGQTEPTFSQRAAAVAEPIGEAVSTGLGAAGDVLGGVGRVGASVLDQVAFFGTGQVPFSEQRDRRLQVEAAQRLADTYQGLFEIQKTINGISTLPFDMRGPIIDSIADDLEVARGKEVADTLRSLRDDPIGQQLASGLGLETALAPSPEGDIMRNLANALAFAETPEQAAEARQLALKDLREIEKEKLSGAVVQKADAILKAADPNKVAAARKDGLSIPELVELGASAGISFTPAEISKMAEDESLFVQGTSGEGSSTQSLESQREAERAGPIVQLFDANGNPIGSARRDSEQTNRVLAAGGRAVPATITGTSEEVGGKLGTTSQNKLEDTIVGNVNRLSRLNGIESGFDADFFGYAARAKRIGLSIQASYDPSSLSEEQKKYLEETSAFFAGVNDDLNMMIHDMGGTQVSKDEEKRLTRVTIKETDNAIEAKSKLDRKIRDTKFGLARDLILRRQGITGNTFDVMDLSDTEKLIDSLASEQIDQALSNGYTEKEAFQAVRDQFLREFGIDIAK